MKPFAKLLALSCALAFLFPACVTVRDCDGNRYRTLEINGMRWMAENLRTTHYADGSPIARGEVTNKEMSCHLKVSILTNGDAFNYPEEDVILKRVTVDYKNDIIGTWEGRISSQEGSEFDDGELHRWEYKTDGTYIYYRQTEEGQWVNGVNAFAEYFVDGSLLCTRWRNNGEGQVENREWWEITSIKNGVMSWTALRNREDGSTYTAAFTMTRVN